MAAALLAVAATTLIGATAEAAQRVVPGEIVVGLPGGKERLLEVDPDRVGRVLRKLRRSGRYAYAVRNYIARSAQTSLPNDPGTTGALGGWTRDQWNFLGSASGAGVTAAWAAAEAAGRAGGSGVTVAVLDTGIAYRDQGKRYRRSPDFGAKRFVPGRDFIDGDKVPLDDHGHGTHVAGTIGENTNNLRDMTGIAYAAKLMPVRVLNAQGRGTALTIAKGVRWAMKHGADVINLSLEFPACPGKLCVSRCAQIAGVCKAIRKAVKAGVVVVAAAGNGSAKSRELAFPARIDQVIAVGATTAAGEVAYYSRQGGKLDLVAPGGGQVGVACVDGPTNDAIVQVSFRGSSRRDFCPQRRAGTSMAAAHVTGTVALVLASRAIGKSPKPKDVERHLECTAQPLGPAPFDPAYGHGLLDAAAATSGPCTGP
ncbi:MAG TPA: S8 family serine peptidase [Solirubrobacterales bacterium]|jgi:serine protease